MEDKSAWTLDEIGCFFIPEHSLTNSKGKAYQGGDKTSLGKHFTKIYDALLSQWRNSSSICLLELGVCSGRFVAMWSDYFPKGHIVAVDHRLSQVDHKGLEKLGAFQHKNVSWVEQDVRDAKQLLEKLGKLNHHEFDVVVDDALHQSEQQWHNFLSLFPLLKSGGFYVIEDLVEAESLLKKIFPLMVGVANPLTTKPKSGGSKKLPKELPMKSSSIQNIQIFPNLLVIQKH